MCHSFFRKSAVIINFYSTVKTLIKVIKIKVPEIKLPEIKVIIMCHLFFRKSAVIINFCSSRLVKGGGYFQLRIYLRAFKNRTRPMIEKVTGVVDTFN